jgi:AcrR family transcriptional regulator
MDGTIGSRHFRSAPAQARSAATVEAILDAGLTILARDGLPGFNTNSLAKAAGINVASLYHYFPNKNAILAALYEREDARRAASVFGSIDAAPAGSDLTPALQAIVAKLIELRRTQPAWEVLRRACRAVPEMKDADERAAAAHGDRLARRLQKLFPELAAERAAIAGRFLVEITFGVLEAAVLHPDKSALIADELVSLLRGYVRDIAETAGRKA